MKKYGCIEKIIEEFAGKDTCAPLTPSSETADVEIGIYVESFDKK